MTLLSEIYDVTLKRAIKNANKNGYVRPTIGQSYMSNRDYIYWKPIPNASMTFPAYSNLTGDLYVYFNGYSNNGLTAHAGPTYNVPDGFTYERIYWPNGHKLVGTGTNVNEYSITGTSWDSYRYDNQIIGKKYYEVTINIGGNYAEIGVVSSLFGYTGVGYVHVSAYGWMYDRTGVYTNHGVKIETPDSFNLGDVIGMAVDANEGKVWWSKNGVWQMDAEGNQPDTVYF